VTGTSYVGAIALILIRAIHGQATPGDVVLAAGLAAGMNALVTTAVLYGTNVLRLLRLAERYVWLEEYARGAWDRQTASSVPERLTQGIDLHDVTFRYPGTETTILDGVSLHLPAGTVIALVGENGAGKTTLVKLLSRFYEPAAGRITVDGADVLRFDIVEWRERVAAAFQDFTRFELLARETVGVGELPRIEDRAAIGAALGRAGATGVVERLPLGLETQLGRDWAGGVELSGGQWQKLALGRAMMRKEPLLLILDEPTASLDAQTEHDLFERYAGAARDTAARTGTVTLLVSHRFSTVRMADLILVLDEGRIREQGSHGELMALGGLYAELYELQARQYR
jgi:ABC-type multidrug transport system fused ATPase/permease subunit